MKVKYMLAIPIFIAFFGVNIFFYVRGKNELVKSNFSSTIEMITYDEKSIAVVYGMGENTILLSWEVGLIDMLCRRIIEIKIRSASYTIKEATTRKIINILFRAEHEDKISLPNSSLES